MWGSQMCVCLHTSGGRVYYGAEYEKLDGSTGRLAEFPISFIKPLEVLHHLTWPDQPITHVCSSEDLLMQDIVDMNYDVQSVQGFTELLVIVAAKNARFFCGFPRPSPKSATQLADDFVENYLNCVKLFRTVFRSNAYWYRRTFRCAVVNPHTEISAAWSEREMNTDCFTFATEAFR